MHQPATLGENLGDVDFEGPHHTGISVTAKHNRLYWRMPPVVVHCIELVIFVMMGACRVAVPSLVSLVYVLIFLLKATLCACHCDQLNRGLSVRMLLLVYTGCHVVVLYLYQFEVVQNLIPLQPSNTTAS